MRKFSPVLMIIISLYIWTFACVTINIYFPEAAVQKTAEEIVDEVRKSEDEGKKKQEGDMISSSFSLVPAAYAQQECTTSLLQKSIEKAKEARKSMPVVKRAQDLAKKLVSDLEKNLQAAKARNDLLGVIAVSQVILKADPEHKQALQLEKESRQNLIKTAVALGSPLKEQDLAWYKIKGEYSFDGNRVVFETGVLGIGPMASNVIITCLMKAKS